MKQRLTLAMLYQLLFLPFLWAEPQEDQVEDPSFNPPEPLTMQASVDHATPSVGDTITFTLSAEYDTTLKGIELPEIGNEIKGFRIVDFGAEPAIEDDGRTRIKKWYKLQTDISGSYVLPAIKLTYQTASGEQKNAQTSEIFIEVKDFTESIGTEK